MSDPSPSREEPVVDQVRAFIAQNFVLASGGSPSELGPEDSLTKLGMIDSTGVLELIAFLEERFGISIADEETVPQNLDSLRLIAEFVERKRAPQ